MGSAYARGFIKSLLEYMARNPDQAAQIEFIADIAHYNGWGLENFDGIPAFQFSGNVNFIANGRISNSMHFPGGKELITMHGTGGFSGDWMMDQILDIPRRSRSSLVDESGYTCCPHYDYTPSCTKLRTILLIFCE